MGRGWVRVAGSPEICGGWDSSWGRAQTTYMFLSSGSCLPSFHCTCSVLLCVCDLLWGCVCRDGLWGEYRGD